ncbi:MAG: ABC transporter ATP-binding protein [Ruminococcaceae bacterium]|nr:ABC transporter ATP-binding protein [Oscillospiraceae bacterium]
MDKNTRQNEIILSVKGVSKAFGDTKVIRDLSFDVHEGEFLTILGSSGCGKTTLLRIISGLEIPDGGEIFLAGDNITSADPNKRDVNTVFQNYALFPHMNVFDNVAYPLKIAKNKPQTAEIARRVADALALVRMSGFEKRFPSSLSGGQKQRVAIARAVISAPKILLLDEPLGALDLNLRREMQGELKKLQKDLGITFIYITHDQEEALNMSDRVAVMKNGRFLQIGTPSEIYDSPEYVYIARFVGDSNILPCTYVSENTVKFAGTTLTVREGGRGHTSGDTVFVSVRGEKITVGANDNSSTVNGVVDDVSFSGGVMRISCNVHGTGITTLRYGLDMSVSAGDQLELSIPPYAGVICEKDEDV